MLYILILYLILINAAGLLLMRRDKSAARKSAWRTPEATLMRIALAGGCFGIYLGMRLFRHKTQHLKFSLGVPLIMAAYILLLTALLVLKNALFSFPTP